VLSFTAVESRPEAVAQAAVEMLCDRVAGPQAPARKRLIEPRLDQKPRVKPEP
jgi:DNA-binding LacI/PurR family transcriptional regulator